MYIIFVYYIMLKQDKLIGNSKNITLEFEIFLKIISLLNLIVPMEISKKK